MKRRIRNVNGLTRSRRYLLWTRVLNVWSFFMALGRRWWEGSSTPTPPQEVIRINSLENAFFRYVFNLTTNVECEYRMFRINETCMGIINFTCHNMLEFIKELKELRCFLHWTRESRESKVFFWSYCWPVNCRQGGKEMLGTRNWHFALAS